jgi:hypothetical protein
VFRFLVLLATESDEKLGAKKNKNKVLLLFIVEPVHDILWGARGICCRFLTSVKEKRRLAFSPSKMRRIVVVCVMSAPLISPYLNPVLVFLVDR